MVRTGTPAVLTGWEDARNPLTGVVVKGHRERLSTRCDQSVPLIARPVHGSNPRCRVVTPIAGWGRVVIAVGCGAVKREATGKVVSP